MVVWLIDQNDTIHHLFFDCYPAKNIWRIIYFALHIDRPNNINHITENWVANQTPLGIKYVTIWLTFLERLISTINQRTQARTNMQHNWSGNGRWMIKHLKLGFYNWYRIATKSYWFFHLYEWQILRQIRPWRIFIAPLSLSCMRYYQNLGRLQNVDSSYGWLLIIDVG